MTNVAVLDDWQFVAADSADWSALRARAPVKFFPEAFLTEEVAAAKLADYEIILSMRERTALPGSLIERLPRLRMLGITGAKNASLDMEAFMQSSVATRSPRSEPVCADGAAASHLRRRIASTTTSALPDQCR